MRSQPALLFAVTLAACASTPQHPTTGAPAERAAQREMTQGEWQRALAEGRFTVVELSAVGPAQGDLLGPTPPDAATAPPGTVWRVVCAPGGSSDTFATERATGRVWRVTTVQRVSAPAGVSVSATRCEAQAVRAPEGALAGTVLVSPP